MNVREQGSRRNILNVYYNNNAGDATKFLYAPDFSRPGLFDRQWENYTPRITWQASSKNKFSFSWDEQPVCRTCTGTASLSGSPSPTTAPEADGHGEFSPQRVQTGRWTNPATSRLLLEAGVGNTFYYWGGKEVDPNPTREPGSYHRRRDRDQPAGQRRADDVPVAELAGQRDRRRELVLQRVVRHRGAQHQGGLPGQLVARRSRDPHEHAEPRILVLRRPSDRHHGVRKPVLQQRPRGDGVVLRAGSVDDEPAHAAGRDSVRPALELVPRRHAAEEHVLPRRQLRPGGRRDRLQGHHAALRRRV